MKNRKGNVAVIAVVIVTIAITAGVVGWMFAKKTQAPVPQQLAVTQSSAQQVQMTRTFNKSTLQSSVLSAVELGLKTKEKNRPWDKKVDITAVDSSLQAAKGKWYAWFFLE